MLSERCAMKLTLFVTTACNLTCDYCYVRARPRSMDDELLDKAVDFGFEKGADEDRLDFGLFGGEPLLAWPQCRRAITRIRSRQTQSSAQVNISLVTNATRLTPEILDFLDDHDVVVQASCDGIPQVQDRHRCFADGSGSSTRVAENLARAVSRLPTVLVNLVYGPDTQAFLPQSIEYLADLGLRHLILNPDYSARWQGREIEDLSRIYGEIVSLYLDRYRREDPLFISLIDEKLAVVLRGGYGPSERCHMGVTEFAVSPQGMVFPCERLVGDGERNAHALGRLGEEAFWTTDHCRAGGNICRAETCQSCSVAEFCMNWCGCSNFFGSGDYERPSAFICASERLAIQAAGQVLEELGEAEAMGLLHHYAGLPMLNSVVSREMV